MSRIAMIDGTPTETPLGPDTSTFLAYDVVNEKLCIYDWNSSTWKFISIDP